MNENNYFQEFFDAYQNELDSSLDQLDYLAQNQR